MEIEMTDEIKAALQQMAENGTIDMIGFLAMLPPEATVSSVADLIDDFYENHYEG